jgi:hypothetical protein
MVGHDEMRILAQGDTALIDRSPESPELVKLFKKRPRREDNSIPDDAQFSWMEYAGGDEVKDDLFPAEIDRVAGVVPTLIAGDDIERGREEVDDLALAFISPLGAEDEQISHQNSSFIKVPFPGISERIRKVDEF